MRHSEAIEHLGDLGTGALDPDTERALTSHIARCAHCREWVDTRDLLVTELWNGTADTGSHPDSDLLALCVLRPAEVLEVDRTDLREHLETCATCRTDVARMRAAVQGARPGAGSTAERPSTAHRHRGALAAAVVLFLLAGGLVLGDLLWGPSHPVGVEGTAEGPEMAGREEPEGITRQLAGRDLEGVQLIHGGRTLEVARLTVKSGADITFRASDVVAFGDGFRVDSGARIAVGSGSAGGAAAPSRNNPSPDRGEAEQSLEERKPVARPD